MIRRIKLTNYMSHEQTVIEPAAGLTVLIGENNSGKSAIVSALQTLCHNASGDYMERHGTRECIVEVETDDGNLFQWRRIKGKVSYEINGKVQDRLKGSVPDELHSLLRMPTVAAGNETFDIHFGEQKDPIFLLNKTSSSRAAFFASSSDAAKLIQMQSRHRDKVREKKSELRSLEKQELKFNQRREQLLAVAPLELQLAEAESLFATIQIQQSQLVQLDQLLRNIDQAQRFTQQLASQAAVLAALLEPPAQQPVAAIERLIAQIRNATCDIEGNSASLQSLTSLEKPPQLADCQLLENRIQKLVQLDQQVQQQQALLTPLSDCPAPPKLADLRELQRTMQAIEQAEKNLERAKVDSAAIQKLASPPESLDVAPLTNVINAIEQRTRALAASEDAFDAITTALKEAEADLKHCADENETCPLCGQELDAETLVAKAMLQGGVDE